MVSDKNNKVIPKNQYAMIVNIDCEEIKGKTLLIVDHTTQIYPKGNTLITYNNNFKKASPVYRRCTCVPQSPT